MRRFEEGHENSEIPRAIAGLHALSGNPEAALDWLERAYDMGCRQPRMLERDPEFDSLRNHPRFRSLLARMHADVARMRERADLAGLAAAAPAGGSMSPLSRQAR